MNQGRRLGALLLQQPEDFPVKRARLPEVESDKDGGLSDVEDFRDAIQARTLDANPKQFPRIALNRAVLVRPMAIGPDKLLRMDLMPTRADRREAASAQAKNDFVTGVVVASDVVVRPAEEVPASPMTQMRVGLGAAGAVTKWWPGPPAKSSSLLPMA